MIKNLNQFLSDLDLKTCIPFTELLFETPPPENLNCLICHGFILNPVVCKCEEKPHYFGQKCLFDHFKNKADCPISHQALNQKEITSVSFDFLEKMGQIKLKCEFCKEFEGNAMGLKHHLRDCGAVLIPCPFYGKYCQEKIMKKDLKKHLREGLNLHIESAKNAFQIEKLQLLFEILQEKLK